MSFKAYLQQFRKSAAERLGFAVLVWHLVWAGFMLAGFVVLLLVKSSLFSSLSVLIMAVPGIAAVALSRFDDRRMRQMLLLGWAVSSLAAVWLTGGMGGPVVIWLIMPLLAAVALNQRLLISQGAALSFMISVIVAYLSLTAPRMAPLGDEALYLSFLGLFSTVIGLGTALMPALRVRVERTRDAEDAREKLLGFLTEQPYLIISLDDQGQITGAFGEAPDGLHRAELISQGLLRSAHLPDRPRLTDAITEALSHGRSEVGFHPQARLDHYWHLALRATEEGQLYGVLRDATLTHARELSLEAARVEAEGISQSKSSFLANMSHELRTPLNAVIGFSDIMRLKLFGPLSDKYSEYAELIWESGQHVLDLINDVLDMSKIEAQKYELSLETFDAREPVSQALSLVRIQALEARIELKTLMPPEPLMVTADKRALKQISLNLLSNALKFTPESGVITLIIDAADRRDLEIVISDTGVGIAPDDLSRLGNPYEQSGNAEQKAMGTGLGLSLVRALSELHQGQMSIESTLGVGTSVRVILPVLAAVKEPSDDLPPDMPEDEEPPRDALLDRERIPPELEGSSEFILRPTSGV